MADIPTRAMERARTMVGHYAHRLGSWMGEPLIRDIAEALVAAREEGRRAGLEEAAKVANAHACDLRDSVERVEDAYAANVLDNCASAIRSRLTTPATTPGKPAQPKRPLTHCAGGEDGDCFHEDCPQLRDGEPHKSGRHCPLDTRGDDDV